MTPAIAKQIRAAKRKPRTPKATKTAAQRWSTAERRAKAASLESKFDQAFALVAPSHFAVMKKDWVFANARGWEIDRAWPHLKIGVEIQGGIWNRGAHGRGIGILRDIDKRRALILAGWQVLEYATNHFADPMGVAREVADLLNGEPQP